MRYKLKNVTLEIKSITVLFTDRNRPEGGIAQFIKNDQTFWTLF